MRSRQLGRSGINARPNCAIVAIRRAVYCFVRRARTRHATASQRPREPQSVKTKSETTREIDARTNQKVEPLQFEVDSHDDYLRLRETFASMPKIPTLLHVDEAPMTKAPSRTYNWFLTSEQSGGSIVIRRADTGARFCRGRAPSSGRGGILLRAGGPIGNDDRQQDRCCWCRHLCLRPAALHARLSAARRQAGQAVLHWNSPAATNG